MSINTGSIKSRTIDNLGLESSVRYAKDVEANDIRLIEDSKIVSRRIEVSVTKPYAPSEFDQLFSFGKSVQWALFTPPPGTESHTRPLFSHQLIPSLGTAEKQEASIDKISGLEDALNKPRKKRLGTWDEQEEKEEQEERKTLSALLKCIERLDRTLTFINVRRNQYHRG
jgi:hypothetical protein